MQKILTINDIKVYSRKQIDAWVQSSNISTFEQLKNGLFFIKILHKLVPHDIARYKIAEKPLNQYQQTQNMNIVKKVLNKHNLQLNMNVQAVVLSKNCFQLANWFKNLYEQNKSDKDTEFHYSEKSHTPSKMVMDEVSRISNYKSLSRATSSDKKGGSTFHANNVKKLGRVTSGFIGVPKTEKFTYTVKIPKDVFESELTYQLFSNNRQLQKQKTNQRSRTLKAQELRHAKSKSKHPKECVNFFDTTFIQKQKRKKHKPTQEQTIANLMKEQALEEQVTGIEKILSSISDYTKKMDPLISVDKMRKEIISIIYRIPVSSFSDGEKQNNFNENK